MIPNNTRSSVIKALFIAILAISFVAPNVTRAQVAPTPTITESQQRATLIQLLNLLIALWNLQFPDKQIAQYSDVATVASTAPVVVNESNVVSTVNTQPVLGVAQAPTSVNFGTQQCIDNVRIPLVISGDWHKTSVTFPAYVAQNNKPNLSMPITAKRDVYPSEPYIDFINWTLDYPITGNVYAKDGSVLANINQTVSVTECK